jgi:hypothetical protein
LALAGESSGSPRRHAVGCVRGFPRDCRRWLSGMAVRRAGRSGVWRLSCCTGCAATRRPAQWRRPGLQHEQGRKTGQQAPESRADSRQGNARGSDQEGQQRGFACGFLAHGGGQSAADGAEQGEAGDGHDQFVREGQEKSADGGPEEPDQQIEDTGGDRGGVTFLRVLMGFAAHADGRGNRCQVQGEAAERRKQEVRRAGPADQRRNRYLVAGGTDDGHARHVLRGHGHHIERQRDADQRPPRQFRSGEYRRRQFELQPFDV